MCDDDILDAINEGRFPSAKRDLAVKLKRFPNKSYYWALNCYYLYAVGDIDQAEKECRTLKLKTPSDPEALEVLENVFNKLGLQTEANEVWENAIKKYPTTKLILTWFNKAVKCFDSRNMQKASILLQKHAKSSREYGIWAAICNYLWSIDTDVEKERALHISLALGLIEKAKPLQNNQEVFVLVKILARMQGYARIVDELQPLNHRELDLILIYLGALDKLQNWQALYNETKKLLFEEDFNDFDTWKYFIKSSKELNIPKSDLENLITLGTRNSYMANIEISKVYESHLNEAIDTYYENFSAKPCCPLDLSNYKLSDSFYQRAIDQSSDILNLDTIDSKSAILLTNIEKLQIIRDANHQVDWSRYAKYKSPELSELYLIYMIQTLKSNWAPDHLIQHIIQLEYYSKEDPENFGVKVWLLNLYEAINASSMALKVYKELKIKMIQHDLYLYKVQLVPSLGNLNDLVQIFRFYMTSDSEVDAFVGNVFQKQLYMNLEDFLRFGKRLSSSLSRHLLIIKIMKMARCLNNEYYNYFYRVLKEKKESILSDEFTVIDNRDFKTEYRLGAQLPQLSFQDQEKAKGKEYVQLCYMKELLIVEQNDIEIGKLFKRFNRWLSNQVYTKQLSPFENHMFKLYLGLFKLVKVKDSKDRVLQLNYIIKNLDFKKIKQAFINKLSPLSSELNQILVELHEITGLIRALLKEKQLLDTAHKLEKEISEFNAYSEQIEYLRSLKGKLNLKNLTETFIDEQLENIEEGLRNSIYKPR